MKDLGPVKCYLGVECVSSDQGILLHQKPYAHQLVLDFCMEGCRSVHTPLCEGVKPGLKLSSKKGTPKIDETTYNQLVGKLILLPHYYSAWHLFLCWFSKSFHDTPTTSTLWCSRHIIWYISNATDLSILLAESSSASPPNHWLCLGKLMPRHAPEGQLKDRCINWLMDPLLGAANAKWLFLHQPLKRNYTKLCQMVLKRGSTSNVWYKNCNKLTCLPLHSTVQICKLLMISKELQLLPSKISIYTANNTSATKLARNPVFHAWTKHLETHHHFVLEGVIARELSLSQIKSED